MDVPENIISQLKCDYCKQYLSCGPVYLCHNEETTTKCGRCSSNDNESAPKKMKLTKLRNETYEICASGFQFPCMYAVNGCTQKLSFSFNQQHLHESLCGYKKTPCPILPSECDWNDLLVKSPNHCQSKHPNNILNNENVFKYSIEEFKNINYLIKAYEGLFLFHQKCDKNSIKMHCSLIHSDSKKFNNYKFSIRIQEKEKYLLYTKRVSFVEEKVIEIKKNTLKDIFDEYGEITFKITISPIHSNSLNPVSVKPTPVPGTSQVCDANERTMMDKKNKVVDSHKKTQKTTAEKKKHKN